MSSTVIPLTKATPDATKPSPKIPSLSPWVAPILICPNRNCSQVMQPKIGKEAKGGDIVLFYNCSNCHYDFKSSLMHANGQSVPEGSLEEIKLPESRI